MTKTWVIADPHFSHDGVCKFLREDGTKLRPFDTSEEMDEVLVDNWNKVVSKEDRVYVLGDLCMKKKGIEVVGRCAGRKVLVKGNHDIFKLKDYTPYFDDIRAYVVMPHFRGETKLIMSHIPIHEESLGRFGVNIHGHLHANSLHDKRYVCVSVEQTGYQPITLDEAYERGQSIQEGL